MTIDITIVEVIESTAEQQVIVECKGTRFGVFDGYKSPVEGGDRFAAAKWMEGTEAEVVLSATTPESVEKSTTRDVGVYPNPESPTDFQHHTFCGTVTEIEPDIESVFEGQHLFGGTVSGNAGVKRAATEAYGTYLTLSLDGDSIYVEIPAEDLDDTSKGETVEITEIRTDLVGIVDERT